MGGPAASALGYTKAGVHAWRGQATLTCRCLQLVQHTCRLVPYHTAPTTLLLHQRCRRQRCALAARSVSPTNGPSRQVIWSCPIFGSLLLVKFCTVDDISTQMLAAQTARCALLNVGVTAYVLHCSKTCCAVKHPGSCVCAVRPSLRSTRPRSACQPARAQQSGEIGTAGLAAAAAGIVAAPVCLLSEYTLATTGAGLPPGPGATLCCVRDVLTLMKEACTGNGVYMRKCVTHVGTQVGCMAQQRAFPTS
jgi:hypothetical protein